MLKYRLMRKVIFLFIILFFLNNAFSQEDSKEVEALFVAQKAQEDGFYEVALNLYERFLVNYPYSKKKPLVNLYIGQCYFFQKKYKEALKKFEELLNASDAQDIKDQVLYWMAEVRFANNDFLGSANIYREILKSFPNSNYKVPSLYSLGFCLYEMKNYKEAIDYFKNIIENYPSDKLSGQAWLKVMDCLYALEDYKGLKEFLENYFKNDISKTEEDEGYVIFYQAEAEYYLGNFELARQIYEKLINESKDERIKSLAKLSLGWCLIKMNKFKEAQDILNLIDGKLLDKKNYENFLLAKAYIFNQMQKFEDALGLYSELIKVASDLNLMEAYIGKGSCLYNLSKYKEAIEVYKEALNRIEPEKVNSQVSDRLHYNLAWAYLKNGDFKEAISEFKKAASLSEDSMIKIASLCLAADTYQDAGEYPRAIQAYEDILKDYPHNLYLDYIQYQLGCCFLKISNYESAILAFRNILSNFPRSTLLDEATYALALVYFQQKDFNKAKEILADFNANFKDSPLSIQAKYLYGSCLYNLERFEEAMGVFEEIIKQYPENKELVQKAEYEIADCLYQMGKEKEAVDRFNLLRIKYPDSPISAEAIWWLGSYYLRIDKLDLAKRYFETLIQNFPQSSILADAYYALGFISADENNFDKAIEFFNKVKEIGEPDLKAQAMIATADVLTRKNEYQQAIQIYLKVIEQYPHLSSLVYPKIAQAKRSLGDLKEAVVFYRKALENAPSKQAGIFQFNIAECLEELGNLNEAVEEYLKVNYLYSEDKTLVAKALLRVAQIYEHKNDIASAKDLYQKVSRMEVNEAKYAQEKLREINY